MGRKSADATNALRIRCARRDKAARAVALPGPRAAVVFFFVFFGGVFLEVEARAFRDAIVGSADGVAESAGIPVNGSSSRISRRVRRFTVTFCMGFKTGEN